jgi:hypothetical protein
MPKSKLSAFLSLLLVFLSGVTVGGFAYRLYMVKTVLSSKEGPRPRRRTPEEFLRQRLAEMRDKVKVDDQQLEQIKLIYDQTSQKYDDMHQKMSAEGQVINADQVAKIKAILRPDQIPIYDQLRAEHEAAHKREVQQRQQNEKK